MNLERSCNDLVLQLPRVPGGLSDIRWDRVRVDQQREAAVTIWKYQLAITDIQQVLMPDGAQLLCAQMQNGSLCLWAFVDPEAEKRVRTIEVIGTGHQNDDVPRKYISTVLMCADTLVWHVFERDL